MRLVYKHWQRKLYVSSKLCVFRNCHPENLQDTYLYNFVVLFQVLNVVIYGKRSSWHIVGAQYKFTSILETFYFLQPNVFKIYKAKFTVTVMQSLNHKLIEHL